jgi:hypothetical protein
MNRILTVIFLAICLIALTKQALGTSWPIFAPPDKELLLNLNFIDVNQCPKGQGKLINSPINISQFLCKNYCPKNWQWVGNSDQQCHDLSDFNFKGFKITHYSDENGTTNYSRVLAMYGPSDTNEVLFEFFMETELDEHWYCVAVNRNTNLLSCACDS